LAWVILLLATTDGAELGMACRPFHPMPGKFVRAVKAQELYT
jgi:hypothetical protein